MPDMLNAEASILFSVVLRLIDIIIKLSKKTDLIPDS